MFGWITRITDRISGAANRRVEDALANLPPRRITYAIPGAPPTGRKVLGRNGIVYQRRDAGPTESESYAPEVLMYGLWEPVGCTHMGEDGCDHKRALYDRWHFWYALLASNGPVELLPPDYRSLEEIRLYGPLGQEWGDPNIPCPWRFLNAKHAEERGLPPGVKLGDICVLGIGHVGPHIDKMGDTLGEVPRTVGIYESAGGASVTREDLDTPCTCKHPERHRPGCARFDRMSGDTSD